MVYRLILKSILGLLVFSVLSSVAFASSADGPSYAKEVFAPEGYLEESSYKLVRGISNAVTSPAEIVKQTIVTIRDRGPMGYLLGPLKGIGMTFFRGVTGVWETATFLFPNSFDGDFSSIINPEFVWTPSGSVYQ